MLDLVSGGRVEFGTGESSSDAELAGFGIDRADKRDAWLEGLETAIRCMTETPFGRCRRSVRVHAAPQCGAQAVQKPHPPLWVACSRRDTILLAAEKGIGALSFAFVEPEDAKKWVDDYGRSSAERCVPVGLAVNPQVACVTPMMCSTRGRGAGSRAGGGQLLRLLARPLLRLRRTRAGHHRCLGGVPRAPGEGRVLTRAALAATAGGLGGESGGRRPHRTTRSHRDAGPVTGVPRALRSGRHRPADLRHAGWSQQARAHHGVDRTVRNRGPPRVHRAGRGGAGGQAGRWEPVIAQALARRDGHHPEMPEGYAIRAIPKQMVEAAGQRAGQQWLESLADKQAAGVEDEEFRRLVEG